MFERVVVSMMYHLFQEKSLCIGGFFISMNYFPSIINFTSGNPMEYKAIAF